MKTLTATEIARNFSGVIDAVMISRQPVVIERNQRAVAKIVPLAPALTAVEIFADWRPSLVKGQGDRWLKDSKTARGHFADLPRNPWDS